MSARSRWPLAVAAAGLGGLAVLFLALASWQWRRAELSRTLIQRFTVADTAEVLDVLPRADTEMDDALRYRRARLEGRFVTDRQFLLDNIVENGRVGYHVLTPFRPRDSHQLVIVNRGWLPAGADRHTLPDVAVPTGDRSVSGRLERLLRPGLRLGESVVVGGDDAVSVVTYPTAADLTALLGVPVLQWQLLLDEDEPGGYQREWQPAALGPDRHLVYAGQWLLFALLAVTIGAGILWRTYGGRRAK